MPERYYVVPMVIARVTPLGGAPRTLHFPKYFKTRFPGGLVLPLDGFDIKHTQLKFGHNGYCLLFADTDDVVHAFLTAQTDVTALDKKPLATDTRRVLGEMLQTAGIVAVDRLGVNMGPDLTVRTLSELALSYQRKAGEKIERGEFVNKEPTIVAPVRKAAADGADAFTGKPIHFGGREH